MRYIINYGWAIFWAIIMLILMSAPAQDLPKAPYFYGFDKLAHCGSFFLLTVLLLWGSILHSKRRSSKIITILIVFGITSFFAFLTEAIQYSFSPGRQADWWDIFADYVGIGMGLFSYILLYRKRDSYK